MMEELSIKVYGEPILRAVCQEVDDSVISRNIATSLSEYLSKMLSAVGVAAPQVGLNMRMFCMLDNNGSLLTIINPQILKREGLLPFSEGCLSIPQVYAKTEVRAKYLTASYYDENFNLKTKTFNGTEAVIFQHEYDHLNGVLFVDHLTKEGREMIAETLSKIEKHTVRTYHPIFKNDPASVVASKYSIYK